VARHIGSTANKGTDICSNLFEFPVESKYDEVA
jgi:hypothetical protein